MGENDHEHIPTVAITPESATDDSILHALDQPIPRTFGHYDQLELVGEGGMGSVYRAWDTRLQRVVALKFIRATSPEMKARLIHEARAQARIDDTRICRVYEVDQIDGRPYVAMQFIRGLTLSEAALEMTTEQKVRVIADVAEAMHSAHRAGLVHRDLKSNNIMVERSEEGEWKPYVLDFGLARETDAELSNTAVMVGTPAFMAPEQARGERRAIDRRTDVYSLGVTLYEILTGALPFFGANAMETLMAILNNEPPRPRALVKSLPVDLETIVLKCLEKDPARRYDSARALADDLRRFLDGEPIAAKPASRWSRVARVARKHRPLVAVVTIAFLVVLAAIGVAIRERLAAQQRAEVAQRLGREITGVESIMRFGSMLPPHDIGREKAIVRGRIDAMRRELARSSASAAAPAHYAIGRGLLVLGEPRQARGELMAAWNRGYRPAEVSYALGLALGEIYQDELAQARLLKGEIRKERMQQIERELRDPAIEYLRNARGASAETPAYGQALVAHYQQQDDIALRRADRALAAVPWLYEAQRLKGEIRQTLATAARDGGDFDGARRLYEQADAEYRRAIAMAASDVESRERLARVWIDVMWMQFYGPGGDLNPAFERALASARTAAAIDPRRAMPYVRMAEAWRILGDQRSSAGENPLDAYAHVRSAAQTAIRLQPETNSAFKESAVAWQGEATYLASTGGNPRPAFEAAIADLGRAIRIDPNDFVAPNSLGNAHVLYAQWIASIGGDPFGLLQTAIRHYEKTLSLAPRYSPAYSNMGIAYTRIAEFQNRRGISPVAALESSIKAYGNAVEINPKFVMALNNRGLSEQEYAKFEEDRGGDPLPWWNAALESFRHAAEINPEFPLPWFNRALVCSDRAGHEYVIGADPSKSVAEAESAFAEGLKRNPNIALAYLFVANARITEARYRIEHGQPATAALDRAMEMIRKAIAIDPQEAQAYQLAIPAYTLRGDFAAGAEAARKALALDANNANTLEDASELYTAWASAKLDQHRTAAEEVRLAREYAGRALRANPRAVQIHFTRARALLVAARAATDPAERKRTAAEAASELQQLVRGNKNWTRLASVILSREDGEGSSSEPL